MEKSVVLVLPARNEASYVHSTFGNIAEVVRSFPDIRFIVLPIDDGSADGTHHLMEESARYYGLDARITHNEQNIGLTPSLRLAYQRAISLDACDVIIKTDFDLDQKGVLEALFPHLSLGYDAVYAINDPFDARYKPHDAMMKRRLTELLSSLNLAPLDPHTTMHKKEHLARLLQENLVTSYPHRWGFDFLLALVSILNGAKTHSFVHNVAYNPARRPDTKVDEQFRAYLYSLKRVFPDLSVPIN